MSRKQEGEQRKSWQSVMGQLRCNQSEDHKDDRDAREKIIVDLAPAVTRICDCSFLSAQFAD
jgi:hypothetical protein